MTDDLERIWKENVVACSRYYSRICLERPRKTVKVSVTISDILAEVRSENLPKRSLEHYRCTIPLLVTKGVDQDNYYLSLRILIT
jgi:hypothetical protein